ncbi:hypothetical protein ABEB36_013874 [Hypothenemus hampei]|uniref:BAH domain-containing protein n=1 Tax=Hypothenemus hampei TaxID=57062 RepID=A0ABD1E5W8_HYPHA
MKQNGGDPLGDSSRKSKKNAFRHLMKGSKMDVMKSGQSTQKNLTKKSGKETKDNVSETIAFVIKGQLTPIKSSTEPKNVVKRLQKARYCKTMPKKSKTDNGPVKSTQKKEAIKQNKCRTKKDLDSSIKRIIKKYAKKFNIKRITEKTSKKSKEKIQKVKNRKKGKEDGKSRVKIKQEQLDQIDVKSIDVKVEPKDEDTSNLTKKLSAQVKEEPSEDVEVSKSVKAPTKKLMVIKKPDKDKKRNKQLQFWNSPKRHRVASLNALAKVHCLYENESKATFDKITEQGVVKKERPQKRTTVGEDSSEDEQQPSKRILRNVPGLRGVGKHWDMHDSTSSDNNSDTESIGNIIVKPKKELLKKCEKNKDVVGLEEDDISAKRKRKPKQQEVYMDLKDMVVKKRMASLNATAILAASYSNDKKLKSSRCSSSSYDSDSSAEEYFAAIEQIDLTKDSSTRLLEEDVVKRENPDGNVIEVHATPNKKVSVILNQDTDVTITGVYVNSTTRSTHHEGYCSIAGMQYRISATSHTQTAATTVSTETLLQPGSSSDNNGQSDGQSSSSNSYTPLDALSNMQPPPGPGIHNTIPGHPIPHSQVHHRSSSSAFTSPPHHQHHQPLAGKRVPPPPPPPSGESPVRYIHGYYQPAGPLISVAHAHGQPSVPPPLSKSVPLSDTSPVSITSSVPQAVPGSNNGDSSDNEVIITSVTSGTSNNNNKEPLANHPPPNVSSYRYPPQYSQYHTYPCPPPPQYHYRTPPPPPTPPYPPHEICYPSAPPGYLRHKYVSSPGGAAYHRYSSYYSGHGAELYPPPSSAPPTPASQQIVSATGSYPGGLMESYPPPGAPLGVSGLVEAYQPHYYSSTYGLPPGCYSHSPSRAISYINTAYQHCPCPLNTCPKNGHTGPLTGDQSKRSANISKDSKPLPPVALALPLEPVSATGPPSPARGSAGMPSGGMPPPPSPAAVNYQQKQKCRSPGVPSVEKRKARVGKANVRNTMQNTMLLMCNPQQDVVKREIESPKDKEQLAKMDVMSELKEDIEIPLAEEAEEKKAIEKDFKVDGLKEIMQEEVTMVVPKEEPLPPCIATVAENVKVKNMKRKQSQTKEQETKVSVKPPPAKKRKLGSYKDFIRIRKSCFNMNNGKKKLMRKGKQLSKVKLTASRKKKLNVSKEQTNNRRTKTVKNTQKTAVKVLDNLITKNLEESVKNCKKEKRTKASRRKSTSKKEVSEQEVKISKKPSTLPKWSNGWTWEGESYESKVFINSDETTVVRRCYPSMRHKEGDLIQPGDCVLLKAGPRKNDLPYVAKIAALWENPEDGEMMMSLLWYYRPEHTEQRRLLTDQPDEVFASRHKDSNSVACIDDKCYVLTFNEYCRYKKHYKRMEEGLEERSRRAVPLPDPYPRLNKQPPSSNISPEMVFFCRKVYDFRQKRIVKNPA